MSSLLWARFSSISQTRLASSQPARTMYLRGAHRSHTGLQTHREKQKQKKAKQAKWPTKTAKLFDKHVNGLRDNGLGTNSDHGNIARRLNGSLRTVTAATPSAPSASSAIYRKLQVRK
jgi:hypothetical protein